MTEKTDEQKKPRLELKKTFDAGKIKQSFSLMEGLVLFLLKLRKKDFFPKKI